MRGVRGVRAALSIRGAPCIGIRKAVTRADVGVQQHRIYVGASKKDGSAVAQDKRYAFVAPVVDLPEWFSYDKAEGQDSTARCPTTPRAATAEGAEGGDWWRWPRRGVAGSATANRRGGLCCGEVTEGRGCAGHLSRR